MRSALGRLGVFVLIVLAIAPFGAPVGASVPAQPNDPGFPVQWNLRMIGAPAAWQRADGAGTTIAIVDSGIDLHHDDLALRDKIVGSVTCVGSNGDETKCHDGGDDDFGHGTHVAGIAAATTNNGVGVAGVAPGALLLDVKVLVPDGSGNATASAADVAAGIRYAADHGATVINLSLGNLETSVFGPSFADAAEYAFSKGSVPVIAAGNNFVLPSGGHNIDAIIVGALNNSGAKASYANNIGDAKWAIMAPGGEPGDTQTSCANSPGGVLSTYFHNGYACLAGTSMAAPHVAGAIAVLRSMGDSPQEAIDQLLATATPMAPTFAFGSGALDLAAATGEGPAPSSAPSSEPTASTDAGSVGTPGDPTGSAPGSSAPPATVANPPSGDTGAIGSGAPAVSLAASGAATAPGRGVTPRNGGGNDPAPGLVAVAVLMASSVAAASGWLLIRGASWARRTP